MNPLKKQVGGNHYKNFKIQPIEFTTENKLGFIQGDVIKRICRYNLEGGKGVQDLEKIKHEIDILVSLQFEPVDLGDNYNDCEKSQSITPSDVYKNAVEHGWWDEPRAFSEIIALCHSELSEALEESRNGKKPNEIYYLNGKPEGIPIELADCIIRIFDYCGMHDIDINEAISKKHEFNKTRPYKHGKKF